MEIAEGVIGEKHPPRLMISCYRYVLTKDARRSLLFAGCLILTVNYLQIRIHQKHSSGADTVHFAFLEASESLDQSAMSCSSFVINYLKLHGLCDCTFFTLTSLHSHSSTKRIYATRFPIAAVLLT